MIKTGIKQITGHHSRFRYWLPDALTRPRTG